MEDIKKIKKGTPFTPEMDLALATSYIQERKVIEAPLKGTLITKREKKAAWERVRDCVNAVGVGNVKTVDQCRDRQRNMVSSINKRKGEVMQTGGGSEPPPLTQAQEILSSVISSDKMNGIPNFVDTFHGSYGIALDKVTTDEEGPTETKCTYAVGDAVFNSLEEACLYVGQQGAGDCTIQVDGATCLRAATNSEETCSAKTQVQPKCNLDEGDVMASTATKTSKSTKSKARTLPPALEDEYMGKKMKIMESEHALRKRLLLAQAKYYEIKTEVLLKSLDTN